VRVEENAEEAATMDAIFGCGMVYVIYGGVKWWLSSQCNALAHAVTVVILSRVVAICSLASSHWPI